MNWAGFAGLKGVKGATASLEAALQPSAVAQPTTAPVEPKVTPAAAQAAQTHLRLTTKAAEARARGALAFGGLAQGERPDKPTVSPVLQPMPQTPGRDQSFVAKVTSAHL